jgi:hypothetical protein
MKFKKLKQIEGFLLGGMIFLLFLIVIVQDILQNRGIDHQVMIYAGQTISTILVFWIAVLLYNIFLFLLISRSVWEKRLNRNLDVVIGAITFIGFTLLLVGAIAGFTYMRTDTINWFFNIKQMIFYNIGIFFEVIGGLYFAITK